MANISMKFILLLATVAVLCSMCSGIPERRPYLPRPTWRTAIAQPTPVPLQPIVLDRRYHREAATVRAPESIRYAVNDAAVR
uniref:Putative secreted protein n=1 Tax=Panstrongylus lignarius TaxID=156445 RepID=A0A224XZN9_9HEMI